MLGEQCIRMHMLHLQNVLAGFRLVFDDPEDSVKTIIDENR